MNTELTAGGHGWRRPGWVRLVGMVAAGCGIFGGGLRSEGALVGGVEVVGETQISGGGEDGYDGANSKGSLGIWKSPKVAVEIFPSAVCFLTYYLGGVADLEGGRIRGLFSIGTMSDSSDPIVDSVFGQTVKRGSRHGPFSEVEPVKVGMSGYGVQPVGYSAIERARTIEQLGIPTTCGMECVAFGESAVSRVSEPRQFTFPVAAFGMIIVLHRRRTPGAVMKTSGWSGG